MPNWEESSKISSKLENLRQDSQPDYKILADTAIAKTWDLQ